MSSTASPWPKAASPRWPACAWRTWRPCGGAAPADSRSFPRATPCALVQLGADTLAVWRRLTPDACDCDHLVNHGPCGALVPDVLCQDIAATVYQPATIGRAAHCSM